MNQGGSSKNKKWLLPVIIGAAVLLLAAGVAIALLIGSQLAGKEPDTKKNIDTTFYWNVEKDKYMDPELMLSNREPAEDGLYHILFAVNGKQVELSVADKKIVDRIDLLEIMCLEFDDNGVVTDAIELEQLQIQSMPNMYIEKITDDQITFNSSIALNGMSLPAAITEAMCIYDITDTASVVGEPTTVNVLDKADIYLDDDNNVTHVYVRERAIESDVYWRVDRMYDSTLKKTTRQPDENGIYSILFAVNGQQVTLQCKDVDVVTEIDGGNAWNAATGLVFDEEGYIIDAPLPVIALKGAVLYHSYDVVAVEGNAFSLVRKLAGTDAGKEFSGTISEDVPIYNVNPTTAEIVGEKTQLQVGDVVQTYTNRDGETLLIYVMNRLVDSPLYYNLERQTNRVADENGYYIFRLAVNGKVKEFRTKDQAVAKALDSYTYKCVGLKVDGSIIKKVYSASNVTGYYEAAANMYVTGLTLPVLSAESISGSSKFNGVIASDAKIYNVSGVGVAVGAKDSLKEGDQIIAYTNTSGELCYIYILNRKVNLPVYWSQTRRYNSVKGETTRVPDAEGYYVFKVVNSKGELISVKTQNKALATKMDSYSPQAFALRVKDGIVQEAYPATAGTGGVWRSQSFQVNSVSKTEIETESRYGSGKTMLTPASNMKVFNIGTSYTNNYGEKTSVKVGDIVYALTNRQNQVEYLYVSRELKSELYWPVARKYNSATGETTRVPDADGYYVIDLLVNGQVKQFKTQEREVASQVDSYRVAMGLVLEGDVIRRACSVTGIKGIKASVASWLDVTKIKGKTVMVQQMIADSDTVGEHYNITLAKDCKVYDVSGYNTPFGAKTTLSVGDRIQAYTNDEDKVVAIFVVRKANRAAGAMAYCEHCQKTVLWQAWGGEGLPAGNAHYHMVRDITLATQLNVSGATVSHDVVIDLNGHALTTKGRGALVQQGGVLSIMDSVGTGKLASKGYTGNAGGILVYDGGIFNLYGGTLTQTEDHLVSKQGGILFVTGAKSEANIYGGTISGGEAITGGNIFMESGTVNLLGGTVTGGKADTGANIYAKAGNLNLLGGTVDGDVNPSAGAVVTVSGKPVIGKGKTSGLILGGVKLNVGKLEEGASICVTAGGVFTKEFADEDAAKAAQRYFYGFDQETKIFADGLVLMATRYQMCDHCSNIVQWSCFAGGALPTTGHYYLAANTSLTGPTTVEGTASDKLDIVMDLRGHTLTADRRIRIKYATVSVVDSIGGGKWLSPGTANGYGGVVMVTTGGTLNLYDGILGETATHSNYGRGIVNMAAGDAIFNMYGGTVIGGVAGSVSGDATAGAAHGGAIYMDYGTFNMTGGHIYGGTAIYGDNIYAHNNSKIILGGTAKVDGGIWVEKNVSVTLTGTPVIEKKDSAYGIRLPAGTKLTVQTLAEGASIDVSGSGTIATAPDSATAALWAEKYFRADGILSEMAASGGDLIIKTVSSIDRCPVGHMTHQGDTKDCPHEIVTWTPWTASDSLPVTTAGNYFLTGPMTVGPNQYVKTDVMLDLNGFDITFAIPASFGGDRQGFNVLKDASLAITDLSGAQGTVKLNMDPSFVTAAYGVIAYVSGDMTFYGGILDGSNVATNRSGGATVCVNTGATFTMYDGTIKGVSGAKNTNGSTIAAFENTVVSIHGGQLVGTRAANGANVYANGNLTITGGTFTPGKLVDATTGLGTNLCVNHASATVTISGNAKFLGGVYVNKATSVTLSGEPTFTAENAPYELKFAAGIPVLDGKGETMLTSKAAAYTVVYGSEHQILGLMPVTDTAESGKLLVGYGRQSITPTTSVPLAGYGNTVNRMSESVQDELYATCIAVTDEKGNTVLLFTQDALNSSLSSTVRQKISQATGVPAGNIIVSATHTHSAPDVSSSSAAIAAYRTEYQTAMVKAAQAALADRAEAQMSLGSVMTDGMNFIRHYKMKDGTVAGSNFGNWSSGIAGHAAQTDPQIQVVKFDRAGEDVVLMNFQAHPCFTDGGGKGTVISADFIAAVRSNVENTGVKFAYFTGAAGNQNADSLINNEKHGMTMAQYGKKLADYVLGIQLTPAKSTTVRVSNVTFTGNVNHEMEDKLEQAKEVVDVWLNGEGQEAAAALAISYGFSSEYHCSAVVRRATLGKTMKVELSAASVGDWSFIAAPFELFAQQSLDIKEKTPDAMTFVITCANGSNGYLATKEAYDYGCYESHTSNFVKGTAEALADVYLSMLLKLKNA